MAAIKVQFQDQLAQVQTSNELEELRIRFLGKKGILTHELRCLGEIPQDERKSHGAGLNELKRDLEDALATRSGQLLVEETSRRVTTERIDVTLPATRPLIGRRHPLLRVMEEIEDVFLALGFDIAEGPEVEWDSNNFEALNMPPEHPARDMWDTYYITPHMLLRTHTSPVQIRCMRSCKPPIRAIMPGLVYRHEALDSTHMDVFLQIEGLVVDHGIAFADLKGLLDLFVRLVFGPDRKTRFVPSYFPFTEPSAEMMVSCAICAGKGCPSCGHSGWLEIMGCGQVHPQVLRNCDIDPETYSGFAFGIGQERVAMLKYDIPEIRLFMENDRRFLEQF